MRMYVWDELVMKRTLNSVYATTTFLRSQSLLVPRKWSGFLSCFSPSLYLSLRFSFDSLVLITAAPQSTPLSSPVSVWESLFPKRKKERKAWSMASITMSGPAKVGWKNPAGKALRSSPPWSHLFSLALISPPDRRLNYGVFFGKVVMNAII